MRFFTAKCTITADFDSIKPHSGTWDQIDKKYIAFPYTDRCVNFGKDKDGFLVGVISSPTDAGEKEIEQVVRERCEEWGVNMLESVEVKETTFRECTDDSQRSFYNNDIVKDAGKLFHAEELFLLLDRTSLFWEYLIDDAIPEGRIREHALETAYAKSLTSEINRVEQKPQSAAAKKTILPVHYIIEGDSPQEYQQAIDILLEALYENGRLPSRHVYVFEADKLGHRFVMRSTLTSEESEFMPLINDSLGCSLEGSSIVISYGTEDEGSHYNKFAYNAFNKMVDELAEHADDIQVVFVIPEHKRDLRNRIMKRFGNPLIYIKPDKKPAASKIDEREALAYLEARAAEDGVSVDEELGAILRRYLQDRSFNDLDIVYDEWKTLAITREYYPQYLSIVQKSMDKAAAAGAGSGKSSAYQRLQELIGLKSVKSQLDDVLARFKMNKELAFAGMKPQPFSMHLVFAGSPGTGKTEVARLYAEILKEEKILSEGRLIVRSGAQGWSVQDAFEEARGSVLFIDEAYGMSDSDHLTTLIALMEERRAETVVILAGYKNEIEGLLSTNPGFRSRIGFFIDFEDYDQDEKFQIFELMLKRGGLQMGEEAASAVKDILARGGKRGDEGNGRFVRKLFEDTVGEQQKRLAANPPDGGYTEEMLAEIRLEDVVAAGSRAARDDAPAREKLSQLIGLDEVKQLVFDRLDYMRVEKAKRDAGIKAPFIPMHMAFKGNPGTGKTEVARLVAQIMREEGVLSVGDCIEVTGNQFFADWVVRAYFSEARGSVLFIDEAYTLASRFSTVAELIACMENFRKDVVVIFAGYTDEINMLLGANPGFASRVKFQLDFPDYSADELMQILDMMVEKMNLRLARGARKAAMEIIERAKKQEHFGNARFVRNLLEDAVVAQGTRLANEGADLGSLDAKALTTLKPCDFEKYADALIKEEQNRRPQIGFVDPQG